MNLQTKKYWYMIFVYSAAHFLIDFACAFLMLRSIAGTPAGYICILLYNFCAFAMQMPIGVLADKLNRNYLFAVMGSILVGLAYGLAAFPIVAVVVIGIGNAMFHIGSGVDVLNISEKKLSALGVFVSPGAFGVYFGTMLGKGSGFSVVFILFALIVAAGMIIISHKAQKEIYLSNEIFSLEGIGSLHDLAAILCLLLVVCLRSFVGLALNFSWKSIGWWGIALICAVVFGKIAGGFIADRFGLIKTSTFSLGIAAILFLLPAIPVAGVIAVLLFNMSMPITLWALAKIFPKAKGFAFGMLTFGLFIGFLPTYLGVAVLPSRSWIFAIPAALSLVLLWAGLRRVKL